MFHCMSGIEGGGEDTRGVGILTPTQIYHFEIRNTVICQTRTQIFLGDILSPIVF